MKKKNSHRNKNIYGAEALNAPHTTVKPQGNGRVAEKERIRNSNTNGHS